MFGRKGNAAPKSRTRKVRLLLSYAPDWIVTIGLAVAFFLLDKIDGFRREFSLTDTTIQHTYTVHERVPNWMLCVICFGVPVVIMPTVNMLTVRSWWDLHNSMLGLILGLATTGAVTQVVKVTVGRPRPDAIARCKPIEGAHDQAVYGLVTTAICTETDSYMMTDGWRSFFSGHSSLSFAGLGFLSFYLAGKLHLFDERGHTGKAWIALAPLTGALLVAVSRTMDYRHHWQDVLVGSVVGLVFSYFAYRQYYPTLESPFSHKPYSPRIPREDYRDSTLPFAVPQAASDEDYSGVVYRRQQGGYNGAKKGMWSDASSNTYPPLGHGNGSEARLRPADQRYDEEEEIDMSLPRGGRTSPPRARASPPLGGRLTPPEASQPRPSGEPLVGMYAREQRTDNTVV